MSEVPEKPSEAPMTPELRALYDRWDAATGQEARQMAWDNIVRYLRDHEQRVGSQAEAQRDAAVEKHRKRQQRGWWPF